METSMYKPNKQINNQLKRKLIIPVDISINMGTLGSIQK